MQGGCPAPNPTLLKCGHFSNVIQPHQKVYICFPTTMAQSTSRTRLYSAPVWCQLVLVEVFLHPGASMPSQGSIFANARYIACQCRRCSRCDWVCVHRRWGWCIGRGSQSGSANEWLKMFLQSLKLKRIRGQILVLLKLH